MGTKQIKNVGIISTRIAGTDGVSLEIEKWAEVLKRNRFNCFYFAGEIDRDEEISFKVDEAHFKHPDIYEIYKSPNILNLCSLRFLAIQAGNSVK